MSDFKRRRHRSSRRAGRASLAALAAAALGGALVTAGVLSAGFARPTISAETFRQLDLFGEVFEQVHENYVVEPEDAELIRGAIEGMLSKLDPHSSYLSAEEFAQMQEQTRGTFAGLGIQVVMDNEGPDKGLVKIVAPIDDTPAARAGLQTNDLIVAIDGENVLGMSIDEAISKLKGPKGTRVEISVVRDRENPPFDLVLVRDIITVQSVSARPEGQFGYIRISTFSEQTDDGIEKALKQLDAEIPGGPKGYVLDLRSNPGGLLDQAVAVADVFLDGGEIVSTRGRRLKDTLREMGTSGDKTRGKPIVVLINGGSASASEIVAGALQDRNRALLLGTKTFGKGSVQTVIPLQNGLQGALRLTTAKYYTPAGRSIQSLGIEPDILMPVVYPGQETPAKRPSERDLPGALAPDADAGEPDKAETVVGQDSPVVEPVQCPEGEDCQLKRALELLADATAYRRALADAGAARQ
ncbi:S41 family peptidase [Amphiplicatus metriothermophilus]|uniref:Carboxyl-terminal processing protease n=1 Tax=Amphiplicatus metriothermophilus TaxID=1519374 RepID=A0A239PJG0_9PROT|nr:S41 family peptidase [Amphiplicatus metriothermophilus]MBB5517899.1 carboxyl-terminal processing protease [Amphiplicatus metriothermophilus]SNT67767.1 carboxyl-terminal processing protease [Amphiplicatus metriothermophilus]